jgi:ABC-type spermidine/putrescine transport system permease subunit II
VPDIFAMNRSFLIVILPAIAVGIGYLLVFHWLGFALEPFRFIGAAILVVGAVIVVQRRQRKKTSRRNR